jgi:hypothetical protein
MNVIDKKIAFALVAGTACLAAVTTAVPAGAQPVPLTCAKAPPAPKGHILARVVEARGLGSGKVRVTLDKGSGAKIETGDDVHMLRCDGSAIHHGEVEIDKVASTTRSEANGRFSDANLVGAWAAIDTGYESKAPQLAGVPKGWQSGYLTSIDGPSSAPDFTLTLGPGDGVVPGDKGYFLTGLSGKREGSDFEIIRLRGRTAVGHMLSGSAHSQNGQMLVVSPSKKSCTANTAELPQGTAQKAAQGILPSGFVFANASIAETNDDQPGFATYTVKLDRGFSHGVMPKARIYMVAHGAISPGQGAEIRMVEKASARATLTTMKGLTFDHAIVAVSGCR